MREQTLSHAAQPCSPAPHQAYLGERHLLAQALIHKLAELGDDLGVGLGDEDLAVALLRTARDRRAARGRQAGSGWEAGSAAGSLG